MKGVTFGSYHSYNDLGLILTGKEIGEAEIKEKLVEVEGASVTLDYTEAFGEVKYGQRPLHFEFKTKVPQSQFLSQYSKVQNALHGRKLKIVLDEEPDYYYIGRIKVSSFTNDKNIGVISIDCTCETWKYKAVETVVTANVSGNSTINLTNSRKRVVPTVTTDASMSISYNGYTSNVGAGTHIVPTLELSEGINPVVVEGTGNITFAYQEGGL